MTSFLDRLTGRNRTSSAHVAKERLKLVLVTDRSNLPQERLEAMQAEILEVIKRYLEIDEPQIVLKFEQRERTNYLVADIPLHRDRAYQAGLEQAPLPSEGPGHASKADPAPPKKHPPRTHGAGGAPQKGKSARARKANPAPPDKDDLQVSGDE